MDCCLELAGAGAFVALQDLGAAGLTSAASEMAAKGRLGLDLDLDLVPLRERLSAAEILVSESQERMLAVVEPGRLDEVVAGLPALGPRRDRRSGRVTEGENLVARSGGEVVVGPAGPPAGRRGSGLRGAARPGARRASRSTSRPLPEPDDLAGAWLALLARPNVASKRWIYERYDHLVGANTIRRPGGDAAVVRLPGSRAGHRAHHRLRRAPLRGSTRAAAAGRRCWRPRGTWRASAPRPVAATDCLNFANPEKGSTGWRLAEAIARDVRRAAGRWGCPSCPGTCPSTMRARAGRSFRRRWWG